MEMRVERIDIKKIIIQVDGKVIESKTKEDNVGQAIEEANIELDVND